MFADANPALLLHVIALWGIAVLIPGPNFLITAHIGANHSRKTVLFAVLGIVLGTIIWGVSGFLGITILFAVAPWSYLALKLIGGAYLIYLGITILFFQHKPNGGDNAIHNLPIQPLSALKTGLLTNLTNPKTAIFVTSLFAAILPLEPSSAEGIMTVFSMGLISALWYGGVGLFFTSPIIRHGYQQIHRWIDRLAGGLFVYFGLRIMTERS